MILIGLLEGKSDLKTWNCKMCITLRGNLCATDIVEVKLTIEANEDKNKKYKSDLKKFTNVDNKTLLGITTNMCEDTL